MSFHRADITNLTSPPSQPEYTPISLINSDLGALGAGAGTTVVADDKPPPNKPKPVRRKARGTFIDWFKTLQPLVIHFLVTILITILILLYINGNNFLLDESTRRPLATLADGTQVPTSQYILLQSDITTIVSAMIVVLNWAALGWATALYWRSSFLLMEKTGLRRRDLEWITGSGVVHPTGYFRYDSMSFIGILLLLTLVPQYSSPLLTGSISWAPSSMLAKLSHDIPTNLSVTGSTRDITGFNRVEWWQNALLIQAAGFSSMAWTQEIEKGVFKRVLPGASQLSVGTIISNVTIPVFWISKIDWFTNETEVYNLVEGSMVDISEYLLLMQGLSTFALYAESNDTTDDPSSLVLTRTCAVVMNASTTKRRGGADSCSANDTIASRFPQNTSLLWDSDWCFAAAQITYHLAAGECYNCPISSFSTVQNNSAITLQPDLIKFAAAPAMQNITNNLNMFNASLPSPLNNPNDYITEVLSRAYSGAWTTLAEATVGNSGTGAYFTNYSPALPSLQARVDLRRVYAWLVLQLSVTIAGVTFLAVQSRSQYPLVGDTRMTAFDLDTSDAPKHFPGLSKDRRLMRVGLKEDGWKVVVDEPRAHEDGM